MDKDSKRVGQTSSLMLCLLPLIESGRTSRHVEAAAADVIAACARFNIWVQTLEQRGSSEQDLNMATALRLIELYGQTDGECRAGVRKFYEDGDQADLVRTLQEAAAKLNRRQLAAS